MKRTIHGYCICRTRNGTNDICCVGCFSYVAEGQYLVVRGDMVFHKEYGEQMKVTSYEEKKQPEDSMAIEKYLGSGAIKGIGPALCGEDRQEV